MPITLTLFWLVLFTLYGACIGSFLNVVAYRLPEGKSLVRPRSHCPKCGHSLAWYDNLPVIGWLLLRGRCRYCKTPISIQYPIVEAVTGLLFGGLFIVYYLTDLRPGFAEAGFVNTWPAYLVQLVLVACLVVATVIDARLYIIPLPIPWVATAVAIVVLPMSVALGWQAPLDDVVPMVNARGLGAALGGIVGLIIAFGLLQTGMLPRSFDEVEDELTDPMPPDEFLHHPHPRREVAKEALFVAFPLIGGILGVALAPAAGGFANEPLPPVMQVLGGTVVGYLVGGGAIWITRILGTLAFGKEAMGLGDVHLLAAIGAVLGPAEALLAFFVAPFLGLLAVLVMVGITAIVKGRVRVIPYGPYLAGGALVVMVFREFIGTLLAI